jgi:RNA polymerase sigma-70 factor (ECF subfamily)
MSYSCSVARNLAAVAKQAGVSEATVSRVLNGKPGISDATRAAVLTALDVIGYERPTQLRSRKARREAPLDEAVPLRAASGTGADPEQEALLADSVGLALLVVLDTLPPAERVAFVLHDTFGLPFGEIASITGRSPAAARQLASRGRRRIQGADPDADAAAGERLARQRRVTEAFITAARGGDLEGLIAVLDPEVVLYSDATASPSGVPLTVHGAAAVAGGARAASARARYGSIALVNGAPGLIMAPRGRLLIALAFTFSGDKISQIDVVADPDRLAALDLAILD